MYLTLSSIMFKIAFLPVDDTYGLIKFVADRQNVDPEAVANTLRKLKNFQHGVTLPTPETLDSLPALLGPSGTVLKEALLNMLTRAKRVQMDNGQSRVVVHSPDDKDFVPFFQKELIPFTELDNDFFPPAVAAYVMEVDFGISHYCESVSRCDGSKANTILQTLALPDDIKDFFRTIRTPEDVRRLGEPEPGAFELCMLRFFVYYLAICEANLHEHDRVVTRLASTPGQFVMGFKAMLYEQLSKFDLTWRALSEEMHYDERRLYRHLAKAEKLIKPDFLLDFTKAFHALLKDRIEDFPDDVEMMHSFLVFTFKHLFVLDELNRDNPVAHWPNAKKHPLPLKQSDLRECLAKFDNYVGFAKSAILKMRNQQGEMSPVSPSEA